MESPEADWKLIATTTARIHNWTHRKWCRPSDPVNILFYKIPLGEIRRFLTNEGWHIGNGLRTATPDQVMPDPTPTNKRHNDLQMFKPESWWVLRRYHMRLWEFGDLITGAIHMDATRAFGHVPTDFESIKRYFAQICRKNSLWQVDENIIDLDNRTSGWNQPFHNGRATVIRHK